MPKYTNKQLFKREPYRSILNLLQIYGLKIKDLENIRSVGLKAYHFMYALGPKVKKDKKLEDFFKDLKLYVDQDLIKPSCIKDSVNLDKCLRLLIKKELIWTTGKPRYYTYHIGPEYYAETLKNDYKNDMDKWHIKSYITDTVFDQEMMNSGFGNKPRHFCNDNNWLLCGLSREMFKYLSKKEKEQLNKYVNNVVSNLEEIVRFKLNFLELKSPDDIRKILKKEKDIDLFNLCNLGFYYLGDPTINPLKYFK